MKKVTIVIIAILVVGFVFNTMTSHRGYRREGFVSSFAHSAVRSAGGYTGYRVAKSIMGDSHHRERRHHYNY